MIRNRGTKDRLKIVRQLDAFPKIPEKYKTSSKIGGTLSVLSRALIIFLLYKEVIYYLDSDLVFKFKPDTDMDSKLKIHIDVTVATPCRSIGADILDSTNQNVFSFGVLEEDDTWWDLCPEQKAYFEYVQHLNDYLREEYHSLTHVIFKEIVFKGDHNVVYSLPQRSNKPNRPHDACRIHGTLTLNKVAGNFHITGGKSLHFPQGHVHISALFDETTHNFTHRINRFSFGDATAGIVHPLEGDEKILGESSMMAQYFIEVVPTDIETFMSRIKTFQYSVKENIRPIDHDKGSHGVPGLYFKYDVSALKVIVEQNRENIVQFLVRLCSITAGIIVICGIINTILQEIRDILLKWISPETYTKLEESQKAKRFNAPGVDTVKVVTKHEPIKTSNLLFSNAHLNADDVQYNFTVKQ
ncbi:endoplasmic reticulum-Golgi intermediate compartment protein 2 isoform X1 [Bradysia coprophila]|uniref:endoplasmic reticulum-Golgi intermediate compartment protein 2 isoform X1 n=1 Tax=Bradysia coprophila TaxID=38358 RepID=UPI00187DB2CC|nr:endoplasmic reticulum-Golgi intermediate compartment protein 2 isoform X1 [Bradysia coprophila]